MMRNIKSIVILIFISLFFFGSCEENFVTPEIQSGGILTDYEGCKTFVTSSNLQAELYSNAEECIEYDYDGESVLILKHINAGFNCCPGKIDATISVTENMIVIEDKEEEQGCFCQCLFDLRYEIVDLEPGEYTIAVSGPYIEGTDERLLYNVQLYGPSSGTFCVNRTHYPWGVEN
jgi:hypothetical protein